MARSSEFQTIRSEGGLLPSDLLRRVLDPRAKLEGTNPESYGLPAGERLNEVITQSWNRLCRHWTEFKAIAENLPSGEAATGPTNDKWTLPLLRELGFGTLPTSAAPEIEGRTYPISRFHGPVPLHLVGCGLNLDRRTAGARGAATSNPHGMVQEFLNRSHGYLWAIVSNGRQLRILRDNQALSRQSFIEFDLEAMFGGQVYPDFVLMWMVAHVSRFLPRVGDKAESCLLERWTKIADEEGTRALGELRGSVAKALQVLGAGLVGHPRNVALQAALSSNQLAPAELHAELLRVVYRLIFLFVAEDRQIEGQPLLHLQDRSGKARLARERYAAHYGTARLRELAGSIRGSRHGDLWRQFKLLGRLLSDDQTLDGARGALALPVLGGFLWSESATLHLSDAELTNHDFLEVLRHLAYTRQGKALRSVDFRNLGAEELGGVYETLLELTPQVSGGGRKFEFAEFAGNERKTSGSYYTPDSLVQCLLDSALDPVVNEVIAGKTPQEAAAAILNLKICDPAVGSGHFLVGAAHRLARHLARARSLAEGESEPSPLHYQHALRDVIGRCLYGVDINPMSAELCRVGLWLEAMEPGKPLSFLDHHIRVGNSLLGATPELIAAGLPDEAFNAIEGDDKAACAELKKLNKGARNAAGPLFAASHAERVSRLAKAAANVAEMPDDRPEDIRAKERAHRLHEETAEFKRGKLIADTWCAAFMYKKKLLPAPAGAVGRGRADGIMQAHIMDLANGGDLSAEHLSAVERLATEHRFFHWHFFFSDVFHRGGFDCVLGNPPWEMLEISGDEPQGVQEAVRCLQHYSGSSGMFRFSGHGRRNLASLFVEQSMRFVGRLGRIGLVIPTGVVTDKPSEQLTKHLLAANLIVSCIDKENGRDFADVHPQQRYAVMVLAGEMRKEPPIFGFLVPSIQAMSDPEFQWTLSGAEILSMCETRIAIPCFRNTFEANAAAACYGHGITFNALSTALASTINSGLFYNFDEVSRAAKIERMQLRESDLHEGFRPIYEGEYFHSYDHRFASFGGGVVSRVDSLQKVDVDFECDTATWASSAEIAARWNKMTGAVPRWVLALRRQASTTNETTAIAAILPMCGTEGSVSCFYGRALSGRLALGLVAIFNSFAFNYLLRMRQSGANVSKTIYSQVPMARSLVEQCLHDDGELHPVQVMALELTYTSTGLRELALDVNYEGPPFSWDDERRIILRTEIEAAIFRSYGIQSALVETIMDSFPIVARRDVASYGSYRTKLDILRSLG